MTKCHLKIDNVLTENQTFFLADAFFLCYNDCRIYHPGSGKFPREQAGERRIS